MKTRLLKGLDTKDEGKVREDFAKAVGFRTHLLKILNEEIDSIHASMRDEENFDSPNWAFKQADRVAQVKALKKISNFLT